MSGNKRKGKPSTDSTNDNNIENDESSMTRRNKKVNVDSSNKEIKNQQTTPTPIPQSSNQIQQQQRANGLANDDSKRAPISFTTASTTNGWTVGGASLKEPTITHIHDNATTTHANTDGSSSSSSSSSSGSWQLDDDDDDEEQLFREALRQEAEAEEAEKQMVAATEQAERAAAAAATPLSSSSSSSPSTGSIKTDSDKAETDAPKGPLPPGSGAARQCCECNGWAYNVIISQHSYYPCIHTYIHTYIYIYACM
jgi:chemotaxis protein histidine kinase CheA